MVIVVAQAVAQDILLIKQLDQVHQDKVMLVVLLGVPVVQWLVVAVQVV
jgi:hypothetical protein